MILVTHSWHKQKVLKVYEFQTLEDALKFIECMTLFKTKSDKKTEKFEII
jgi:hypothetical protein